MNNEQILKMVKDGTITVDEGVKLMEAMGKSEIEPAKFEVTQGNKIKMLRILVDAVDDNGKKVNVSVNLPVNLIKVMLESGQDLDFNGINVSEKIDIDMILKAIENDVMGEIITVDSEDAKVRIFIQ